MQVLRRLAREGTVPARRAEEAVLDLQDLRITRYPHFVLLMEIWQRRHNLSAYDAAYIVLVDSARLCSRVTAGSLALQAMHQLSRCFRPAVSPHPWPLLDTALKNLSCRPRLSSQPKPKMEQECSKLNLDHSHYGIEM